MQAATLVKPVLSVLAALALISAVQAQPTPANSLGRTEVLRHDLDKKHEAIQVRVDFPRGVAAPRHAHPGVEIAYVLSGTIEYELEGKTVRLEAGQSLFIPAGAVHSARNVGSGTSAELATYLVRKGQPIVVLAK